MRNLEIISAGDRIDTMFGYLMITGSNGSGLIWCDEYEINEDGEDVKTGERNLTLQDIKSIMHEYDGKNHNIIFE